MKKRNGFVSNSSTSSFCIYGATIETDRVDEGALEKLGIETHYGDPSFAEVYVGRSWCNIKDDETGAQFKKNVEDVLKDVFGIDKCSTLEQAWYDG